MKKVGFGTIELRIAYFNLVVPRSGVQIGYKNGESTMARYRLLEKGPDDKSTYSECWGSTATSNGREIASGEKLLDLLDAVDKMNHDNWSIYGPGNRYICGSRRSYYALSSVAKELAKLRKEE
jgi:hypothetical protein